MAIKKSALSSSLCKFCDELNGSKIRLLKQGMMQELLTGRIYLI
jgi:hypothetical protein